MTNQYSKQVEQCVQKIIEIVNKRFERLSAGMLTRYEESAIRNEIQTMLAQTQQEAVSAEREKIIKKYGRYIEHGQYQAKTLKEALQCD